MIFQEDTNNLAALARTRPVRSNQDLVPSDAESLFSAFDLIANEEQSVSRQRHFQPRWEQRADSITKLGGNGELVERAYNLTPFTVQRQMRELMAMGEITVGDAGTNDVDFQGKRLTVFDDPQQGFIGTTPRAKAILASYPQFAAAARTLSLFKDQEGVKSDDDLEEEVRQVTEIIRKSSQDVLARSESFFSVLAGTALAATTDPLVLATLPLGAAPKGATVFARAATAFAQEAAIAAAIEVPIQAKVFDFKAEINSPWSLKDASFNVLAAAGGAGFLRGLFQGGADTVVKLAGSLDAKTAQKAVNAHRKAVNAGEVIETPETKDAANVLEAYVFEASQNPLKDAKAHADAVHKARLDIAEGRAVDVQSIVKDVEPAPTTKPTDVLREAVQRELRTEKPNLDVPRETIKAPEIDLPDDLKFTPEQTARIERAVANDLQLPDEVRITGDGEEVITTRKVNDVLKELDNQEKVLQEIRTCATR